VIIGNDDADAASRARNNPGLTFQQGTHRGLGHSSKMATAGTARQTEIKLRKLSGLTAEVLCPNAERARHISTWSEVL
jgi:hypothetical protein